MKYQTLRTDGLVLAGQLLKLGPTHLDLEVQQ